MIVLFMKFFLTLPFLLRVIIFLLFAAAIWRLFGKTLLWFLSLIPFTLEKIFVLLYQLIEFPIAILHKKCGAGFYKIDNYMAEIGGKADAVLMDWYYAWHFKYQFKWGRVIIVCVICFAFVVLPSFMPVKNNVLKAGERLYLSGEKRIAAFLDKHKEKSLIKKALAEKSKQAQLDKEKSENPIIELIVTNVRTSLLVRDQPDINNGNILDRLKNGDTVDWTGELVFAETEQGHVEAWAKIKIRNGVEGWSRFSYLYPANYKGINFYVKKN